MQSKISKYLSQPAPVNERPWLSVLLCVGIVIFILAIFEPFNFKLNSLGQVWVLVGFAVLTMFVTTIAFVLFPKIFKRFYNPDKWTIGKSLLNNVFFLIIMGIGVVCYDYFIVMKQLPEYFPMGFLVDLFAALTIGIVPLSIITIITQNSALKRNLNSSKEINQILSERIKTSTKEDDLISLNGSTKESISIKPEDILYIESEGNYVNVHYRQGDKATYKQLRSTIKQMEESLKNYSMFIRCHRAFIVNINHISSTQGNAQGYQLTLSNVHQEIPVSRTYLKNLKDALH
ncbi:LytTR family DNA-binding domain-containing protein [Bacteroides sp. 519]|uniref:LytTR family DNA-binding domain-containing protein n=1 Tax=Bacteroides sp. 519 TaxID=2302937 RepID=UPI0013D2062C|nr:LytTR family DNA-binding domain-containing protein [Bacteroides sp. 519]NDV60099.1 LytTR family transcriptional regulator [Bacteroides sp. 519]